MKRPGTSRAFPIDRAHGVRLNQLSIRTYSLNYTTIDLNTSKLYVSYCLLRSQTRRISNPPGLLPPLSSNCDSSNLHRR